MILIRHGDTDYAQVTQRGFIGHGRDLSPLTETGKKQILNAAKNQLLSGIQLVVSSPYTRAVQSAAIISKFRNVDMEIEIDLHEWLPDLNFEYDNNDYVKNTAKLCSEYKGVCPLECPFKFENLEDVFKRTYECLKKYTAYDKIAVVSHSVVFRQLTGSRRLGLGGVYEIDFDEGLKWCGYVAS